MQVSSDSPSPAKRTRAKPKAETAEVAAPKKKITLRKKPAAPVDEPRVGQPNRDELMQLIATTAYFIAAQRDFLPGREIDDWLEAERQIRTRYPG